MDASAIIPIIVAIITSGGTLAGVLISNKNNTLKMMNELEKQQISMKSDLQLQQEKFKAELGKQQIVNKAELEKTQAVINAQIQELTREVREHNNFAKRVPVLEEKMDVANRRIKDLENKG